MEMTLRVRDYETLKNGVNIPSSELGNPHRTRVPTFPQQPRLLVPDFTTCRIPPKSRSFPDSCAEPLLIHTRKLSFASALPNSGNSLSGNATGRLPGTRKRSSRGCQWSTSAPPGRCLGVCACATVEPEPEEPHGANDLDSQARRCEKDRTGWNGLHL